MTVSDAFAQLTPVVAALPVRRGGRVTAFDGSLVEAVGLDALVGARARIGPGRQMAEIIGFRDDRALIDRRAHV